MSFYDYNFKEDCWFRKWLEWEKMRTLRLSRISPDDLLSIIPWLAPGCALGIRPEPCLNQHHTPQRTMTLRLDLTHQGHWRIDRVPKCSLMYFSLDLSTLWLWIWNPTVWTTEIASGSLECENLGDEVICRQIVSPVAWRRSCISLRVAHDLSHDNKRMYVSTFLNDRTSFVCRCLLYVQCLLPYSWREKRSVVTLSIKPQKRLKVIFVTSIASRVFV